jgi:flagellar FliJ protein
MKPFNFGLEKILNLREYHEDEAKIELGRAISVLSDLENKIAALGRERARAASQQFSSGNNANMIQQYTFYILRLDNKKEELIKEAAMAELEVEKAREVFIEASRERKVLDKLKEKRKKEHRKEWLAEEGKAFDDAGGRKRN